MIITQRVTSLAYLLQDNLTSQEVNANHTNSSNDCDISRINKIPSPLEYFAYTLAFQTLMCGPVIFYYDYIKFIEGSKDMMKTEEPSPRRIIIYKVAGSVAAAILFLVLGQCYPITALHDLTDPYSEISRSWSALYLLWYSYLATLVVRCKYYHVWLLSEAICYNSGMGFDGFDNNGAPKWYQISNVDVLNIEFSLNFRNSVASWNKNTREWLQQIAYRRGGVAYRTARTYFFSALWHGFYPGYYLTFFAGWLFTVTSNKISKFAQPFIISSQPKKVAYNILAFVTTRVALTYTTVPFVLLHLAPSIAFYGKLYYFLHIMALGVLFSLGNKSHISSSVQTYDLPQAPSNVNNSNINLKKKSEDGAKSTDYKLATQNS